MNHLRQNLRRIGKTISIYLSIYLFTVLVIEMEIILFDGTNYCIIHNTVPTEQNRT